MSNLGEVPIRIPPGSVIRRVVLQDCQGRPIGSTTINEIKPSSGDWIQVTFEESESDNANR
jgi:hypothetical protein